MMRLTRKMLGFLAVYSAIFFFLRSDAAFNAHILMDSEAELGGTPHLFTAIGTMFSIIGGFIIQNRWIRWNTLIDTIRTEVSILEALAMHARFLPREVGAGITAAIHDFAQAIVDEGLERSGAGGSMLEEKALASLHAAISGASQRGVAIATEIKLYADLNTQRRNRLHHSANHIPPVLRAMMLGACVLLWSQALLIGAPNVWIDYLFTAGIAGLACLIYLVIEDLDNPLQPGFWALTPKDYQALLDQIKASESLIQ